MCFARAAGSSVWLIVADVLGHGEAAYRTAQAVLQVLDSGFEPYMEGVLQRVEEAVQDGRGCALFVGGLEEREVEYVLVGNIRAWLLGKNLKTMLFGQPGVVGPRRFVRRINRVGLESPAMVMVCTDGIRQAFYPKADFLWMPAGEVSSALKQILLDYGIAEDDATVVMARRRWESG